MKKKIKKKKTPKISKLKRPKKTVSRNKRPASKPRKVVKKPRKVERRPKKVRKMRKESPRKTKQKLVRKKEKMKEIKQKIQKEEKRKEVPVKGTKAAKQKPVTAKGGKKTKKSEEVVKQVIQKEIKNKAVKIQSHVRDIMDIEYKTIGVNQKVSSVLETMLEYSISYLPVIDKKGRVVGIIEQDELMKFLEKKNVFDSKDDELEFQKVVNLTAKDLMKTPVFIKGDENIVDASEKMAKENLETMFVTDKGKTIGMVTRNKLMRAIQSEYFMNKAALAGKILVKTDIDNLMDLVKQKKSIKIKDVIKQLNVPKDKVEEWAILLESEGIIEIDHPLVGAQKLRWKDDK